MSIVQAGSSNGGPPKLVLNGAGDLVAKLSPSTDEFHVHLVATVRPKGAPGSDLGPQGTLELILKKSSLEARGPLHGQPLLQVAFRALDGSGTVVQESQLKGPLGTEDAVRFYELAQQQHRDLERLRDTVRATLGEQVLADVLRPDSSLALKKSDLLAAWRAGSGGELTRAREEAARWRAVAEERLKESDELRDELLRLRQSVIESEAEDVRVLEELQGALEGKDQELKELSQDCSALIEEVMRLRSTLAERQGQLHDLTQEVTSLRRTFYSSLAEGKHIHAASLPPPPLPEPPKVGTVRDARTGDPAFFSAEPSALDAIPEAEQGEGPAPQPVDPMAELRRWKDRQDGRLEALMDPNRLPDKYTSLGKKRSGPTATDLKPAKGRKGGAQKGEQPPPPSSESAAPPLSEPQEPDLEELVAEALVMDAVERERVRTFGAALRHSYHKGLLKTCLRTWSRTAAESRQLRGMIVKADLFRDSFRRKLFFRAWRTAVRIAAHAQRKAAEACLKIQQEREQSREPDRPSVVALARTAPPTMSPRVSRPESSPPRERHSKGATIPSVRIPGPSALKSPRSVSPAPSSNRAVSPGPNRALSPALSLHDADAETLAAAANAALFEAAAAIHRKESLSQGGRPSDPGSSASSAALRLIAQEHEPPVRTAMMAYKSLPSNFQQLIEEEPRHHVFRMPSVPSGSEIPSPTASQSNLAPLSPRTMQLRTSQLSSSLHSTQLDASPLSPIQKRSSDNSTATSLSFGFEPPNVVHQLKRTVPQPAKQGANARKSDEGQSHSSGRRTQRSTFEDFLASSDTPEAQALVRQRSASGGLSPRPSGPGGEVPLSPRVMELRYSQLSSGMGTEATQSRVGDDRQTGPRAQFTVPSLGSVSFGANYGLQEEPSVDTPVAFGQQGEGDMFTDRSLSLRMDLGKRLDEVAEDSGEGEGEEEEEGRGKGVSTHAAAPLDTEYSLGLASSSDDLSLLLKRDGSGPQHQPPIFFRSSQPSLPEEPSMKFHLQPHDLEDRPSPSLARDLAPGEIEDEAGEESDFDAALRTAEREQRTREQRKKIWRFRAQSIYRLLTGILREWSAVASQAAAERRLQEYEDLLLQAAQANRRDSVGNNSSIIERFLDDELALANMHPPNQNGLQAHGQRVHANRPLAP